MSGTSLDGVDAAWIETDGHRISHIGGGLTLPYPDELRANLRSCLGKKEASQEIIAAMTIHHRKAVDALLQKEGMSIEQIDVIGFHGQTIFHAPKKGLTVQIGDATLLAQETSCQVVADFRSFDVAHGGEGAPLAPIYHAALTEGSPRPLAILNIGGVANITYINENDELIAFDTGTGNALIDDLLRKKTGQPFDMGGATAAQGQIQTSMLGRWLGHSFFLQPYPKSLDRDQFSFALQEALLLSPEDGAATLTAFTVQGILRALATLPTTPDMMLVCGGGAHNGFMMAKLEQEAPCNIVPGKKAGLDTDFIEAQAFGFLAVRHLLHLPQSFPGTTGVSKPLTGGVLFTP